jgi:hypothetical protein
LHDDNEYEENEDINNNQTKNKSRINSKKPISRYNSQRSKNANGEEKMHKRFSKFSENHYNSNTIVSKSNNINEQNDNKENKNKNLLKSIENPSKNILGEIQNNKINKHNNYNDNIVTAKPTEATKKKNNIGCNCLVF